MKKKSKIKNRLIIPLVALALILGMVSVFADVTIDWLYPTSDLITNQSQVNLSWWVQNDNLQNLTFSDNGTNYTLYDSSLVLFYNFDNRSALGENDTHVVDLSMYGNNGTPSGYSIFNASGGRYNGAFEFNGSNKINVPNSSVLNSNVTQQTLAFWFKANNLPATDFTLTASGYYRRIYMASNGYLRDVEKVNVTEKTGNINYACSPNTWYHLVITYNGTSGKWAYYLNYNLSKGNIGTEVGLFNYANSQSNNLTIGDGTSTTNFNGTIDDFMLFNRSLSDLEVKNLFDSQITKYNSTYWEFNNTQNTSATGENYYLCSSNATQQVCGASQNVRKESNLTFNFTNSLGLVNSKFYGTTDKGFFVDGKLIDIDGDGSETNASNKTEHQNAFLNSGMTFIRREIGILNSYSNTSDSSGVNFTGDYSSMVSLVEFADDNNLTVLFMIKNMPDWLADTTYCVNGTYTCPPSNYTKWENIIYDMVERVTADGNYSDNVMFEVWNEPDLSGMFLYNITRGYTTVNTTVYTEYNKLYNSTYYAIKRYNPSIQVGGPTVANYRSAGTKALMMVSYFLDDFANQTDFVSIHQYTDAGVNFDVELDSNIALLRSNLTAYGSNCSKIIISEWADKRSGVQNATSGTNYYIHNRNIASFYLTLLNSIPNNFSGTYYQWSEVVSYDNVTQYTEYPNKYHMFSESVLDNEYTVPYNVTKNFAHLCPAGATVYQSSNDDSTIKQVSCKKGNMKSIIIINTDTNAKNITLNLTGSGISNLYNYSNLSQVYTPTADSLNIGILDSYGILYLTEDLQSPSITINSPTASTYTTNSLWFNVTLDEEGTSCNYTINGNTYSMEQGGYLAFFSDYRTIPEGSDQVTFYCSDTSGNIGTAIVSFEAYENTCGYFTQVGFRLISLFMSLVIFVPLVIYFKNKDWELNAIDLILIFVSIIIGISLWLISGQMMGNLCDVPINT